MNPTTNNKIDEQEALAAFTNDEHVAEIVRNYLHLLTVTVLCKWNKQRNVFEQS